MTRICLAALLALLLVFTAQGPAADAPDGGFQILKTIKVGGEGGWDYCTVDPEGRRLYVSRSNRVIVIDPDKGEVVGEIKNTSGVHGIAIAPKHKKGFTSNGKDNNVTVFDIKDLKELSKPEVGKGPDGILYDGFSDRVFTFNGAGNDATAIDAESGKVVGTVKLEGRPESGASDEKGTVYVNLVNKNEVVAFDSKKLEVKGRWKTGDGTGPTGMGIDRAKGRLFVSCRNEKMVIMDADKGKVIETLKIGNGTDFAAFDQETGLAFSSNKDGTLTVIGPEKDTYKVVANVKTQEGSKTMALDTKTHNVYLPAMEARKADTFAILVVGKKPGAEK
jgi:WD40 repeat protein